MPILLVSQLQYCPDGRRKSGVTIKWHGSVLPRRYQTSWQTAQLWVTWKADFTCPEALEMQSSERQWSSCPSLLKFLVIVERKKTSVSSRLSGAQTIWGPHFAKPGKATVSSSGLSCLPVNEQELGQTAPQVIQRQSYSSSSLWCSVECSHALFKWQKL